MLAGLEVLFADAPPLATILEMEGLESMTKFPMSCWKAICKDSESEDFPAAEKTVVTSVPCRAGEVEYWYLKLRVSARLA